MIAAILLLGLGLGLIVAEVFFPSFGILSHYEGEKAEPQLPTNVYRIDAGGSVSVVAEGINQPNGLAFSPDESILYLRVPDIQTAHRELGERGIQFDAAPHMIHKHADGTEEWMAFFKDPEGRPLAIMAQARK